MRESALQKQLLLDRIERQRHELQRDFRELKDGLGWSRVLAGSVLSLVGRRPPRWKTWARILAILPVASRLARLFLGKRRTKKNG